ncbi:MAG TPA: VWA domain-containing protein, partial [Thermaerobacter sp.]
MGVRMTPEAVTGPQQAQRGGRNLRDRVILLARRLRAAGVRVTPGDVVASLQALAAVDLGDPDDVRHALRLTLAHRVEDLPAVDRLVEELLWGEQPRAGTGTPPEAAGWYDPDAVAPPDDAGAPAEEPGAGEGGGGGEGGGPGGAGPARDEERVEAVVVAAVGPGPDAGRSGSDEAGEVGDAAARRDESAPGGGLPGGYSRLAVLTRRDLRDVPAEDQRLLEEIAARIGRILATRVSRRYRRARTGRIDGRRALREAGRRAGDLIRWPRLRRRVRKPRLVCLLDVSGSMDVY